MTAEAQGAAGSQQLSLGVDVERLQEQNGSGSDLPTDMQDITEHFRPPSEKMKT